MSDAFHAGSFPKRYARVAIATCCLAVLSVFSGNLSAQNPSQSLNRAELTPGQIQSPFAPSISSTGVEDGYAAPSPNNADLGEQRILKQVEEYQPFSLLVASPIYYTSNAALVSRGEQGDVIFVPGVAITYSPRITKTLFAEFTVQQQFFEYARFGDLNFGSFDAIAGLVYYLPQFHNLTLRARYDFNHLTNNGYDAFFSNNSIILAAELPIPFGRAQQFSIGAYTNLSFYASPDHAEYNDYEMYVGYQVSLSRSFALDAVGRVAVHDYHPNDRTDVTEILGLSANYRLSKYLTISAISSFAWNQSNHSVFDYTDVNVGGSVAFTLRF
jgi:hypothetical protein